MNVHEAKEVEIEFYSLEGWSPPNHVEVYFFISVYIGSIFILHILLGCMPFVAKMPLISKTAFMRHLLAATLY